MKKLNSGQSFIEVIFAVSIIGLILAGFVSAMLLFSKTSQVSESGSPTPTNTPAPSPTPTLVTDPICSICSCSGTSYVVATCNGDTVYVDCNTNTCWTPTAGSTYAWSSSSANASSCIGQGSSFEACHYCDTLDYGGHTDWYLPDRYELADLCNSGSCSGTCFGGDGSTGYYWSSTEFYSSHAYYVYFNNCDTGYGSKTDYYGIYYVRCVR